jgi:hypothetical protein
MHRIHPSISEDLMVRTFNAFDPVRVVFLAAFAGVTSSNPVGRPRLHASPVVLPPAPPGQPTEDRSMSVLVSVHHPCNPRTEGARLRPVLDETR